MTKIIPVPGQLRRHVLKQGRGAAASPGEVHLFATCEEGDKKLKAHDMSVLNSIDLNLTNAALGAALDIARGWLNSDNGNNVMAGKSMLKFELEYEPDDPERSGTRSRCRRALRVSSSDSTATSRPSTSRSPRSSGRTWTV
ncbi:hypothetical protein ACR6C2_16910 [Streptomyces sp. INA 01156]